MFDLSGIGMKKSAQLVPATCNKKNIILVFASIEIESTVTKIEIMQSTCAVPEHVCKLLAVFLPVWLQLVGKHW